MTRILAVSDSHGDENGLRHLLEQVWKQTGPIDAYFHLGDGARDFQRLDKLIWSRDPQAVRLGVKGNCDLGMDLPERLIRQVGPWRVLLTHGHRYHVKDTLDVLEDEAWAEECDIALFGHTHIPYHARGLTLLVNPGAAMDGWAALITGDRESGPSVRSLRFD